MHIFYRENLSLIITKCIIFMVSQKEFDMTFNSNSYFATIQNRLDVVTAIPNTRTFPECLPQRINNYTPMIELFRELVMTSRSSYDVLFKIRNP